MAPRLTQIMFLGFLVPASMSACGRKDATAGNADPVGPEKASGLVELSAPQLQSAKIAVAKVEKRAQSAFLSATAEIQPAADGVARVGPRLAGRIAALKAGAGDPVTRGQVLAVIDSPELGRAKADYLAALSMSKVTRQTADREKALFAEKITSERDWRQAEAEAEKARTEKEAAENRLHTLGLSDADLARLRPEGHYDSTMPVPAPLDGVVVERSATLGQMVEPSATLFVIMDLRQVWVLVDVYEQDLARVTTGQEVEARVAAFPQKGFAGTVENIGAVVDPRTRAVKARVVLPNPSGELKPGMFATVELRGSAGATAQRLVAPAAAIQRDRDRSIVFVPKGERAFEPREVTLGRSSGDWVEVLSGVAEGDAVVTSGSFLLKSELRKGELEAEE